MNELKTEKIKLKKKKKEKNIGRKKTLKDAVMNDMNCVHNTTTYDYLRLQVVTHKKEKKKLKN